MRLICSIELMPPPYASGMKASDGKFLDQHVVGLALLERRSDVDNDQLVAVQIVEQLDRVDRIAEI